MVKMTTLANRKPRQMSGGQQQRVALARALVNQPSVLLLDEPLGALDRKLRQEMQIELKLLQSQLGITFIFVTHDQEEALSMSDRIAVMLDGHVEQLDDPDEIYERPASAFVAGFIGQNNFLEGVVAEDGRLRADGVIVDRASGADGATPGRPGLAAVRPEAITITEPGASRRAEPAGRHAGRHLPPRRRDPVRRHSSGTREILVRLPRHQAPKLAAGQPVWCSWSAELVQLFPHDQAELVLMTDPIDEIVPAEHLNTHRGEPHGTQRRHRLGSCSRGTARRADRRSP